jgi:coenzyme F420-reducing hydrogenase delta subunit
MRLEYPHNVRVVRLPCTGKVDVLYLLEAFRAGADGVMVVGCLEGECHYIRGNLKARKRVERTKRILDETRIGGDRVEMFNLSASQAQVFVQHVTTMVDRVRELGPSPIKSPGAPRSSKAEPTPEAGAPAGEDA